MKEVLLGQWIQALKSGKYVQIQNKLDDRSVYPNYCCLGVLSVITDHRHATGGLAYPDCEASRVAPVCTASETAYVIPLNDDGPVDQYARVLWLLQEAPELFITE